MRDKAPAQRMVFPYPLSPIPFFPTDRFLNDPFGPRKYPFKRKRAACFGRLFIQFNALPWSDHGLTL
jgi:hypothetical protein